MNILKNIFGKEKCFDCGSLSVEGRTDIKNKFHCMNCISSQFNDKEAVKEILRTPTVVKQEEPTTIEYDNDLCKSQNEALDFFSEIYGLDKFKEAIYLTITSDEAAHRLLVGPPAGGKSLFGLIMMKKMKDTIYFDAANTSGAGLIDTLANNRNAKRLFIDEIGKLNKKDMACLLGLLANGIVVKTLKGKRISFEMKGLHVIATTNSTVKLDKAYMSRFLVSVIPEYSDDEFAKVLEFCLKDKLPAETTHMIASAMLADGKKDVRKAMQISALIRKYHTNEDVKRIVTQELENDNNEEVIDFL